MSTKTITIRVSEQAAQAYELASEDVRRRLDAVMSLRITEATRLDRQFDYVLQEVSRTARQRGLTAAHLNDLLHMHAE